MAQFGSASKRRLRTVDRKLRKILEVAIQYFDFTVVCGYRDEASQNFAYENKNSTKQWPDSKHNIVPSRAVDIAPWNVETHEIDWDNRDRFIYLMAFVIGIAYQQGVNVRWGGDWDSDNFIKDHKFIDFPHLELVE